MPQPRLKYTMAAACAACLGVTGVLWACPQTRPPLLLRWAVVFFGPPSVTLTESHATAPGGPAFDHSLLDALLRQHVHQGGVDYAALQQAPQQLDTYLHTLADAPLQKLGRDEKLALLINAYNAFTLRLILDHRQPGSIKDIPADQRWDAPRWPLAGETISLNHLEHVMIRSNFKEPRIHFALVCAAVGCPPLRDEAYTGAKLEAQLADQTRRVHHDGRWLRLTDQTLFLTQLYAWYADDFEQVAPSVLDYVATHVPALQQMLDTGRRPDLRYLDYDWSLNAARPKQEPAP